MSLKMVVEEIKRNKRFLITTHKNPESDALGSELAFLKLLNSLGKEGVIINEDRAPYESEFLPGLNKIRRFRPRYKTLEYDCFVLLDCSDITRCGQVSQINRHRRPVINIDHHVSNTYFGDINWVEPVASSAAEMVYKIYKRLGVPFDKESALLIYTGMLTDTGSFRYSNTSSFTHQAAARLLKEGVNAADIYRESFENIPFQDTKLLIKALAGLKRHHDGRIITCSIRKKMLKESSPSIDIADHVLNFARAIKNVEVVVLFKENLGLNDEVRVNFRSQGRIDVNKIASFFNGGGHKTASGATINGNISDIEKIVLKRVKESFRKV